MKITENQKVTKELLTKVLAEVWNNVTFKKQFIAHPEEAIYQLTGKRLELKKGIKMIVVDQTEKDTFYFNIPEKPDMEDVELSEGQLDLVAGGGFWGALAGAAVAGIMPGGLIGVGAAVGSAYTDSAEQERIDAEHK